MLTLDEVVERADRQLHPLTRREVAPDRRAAALREELAWAVGPATSDLEFARDYQEQMPHPGTEPADYLNRWVDLSPDLQVLLGPRHRARDLTRPFVAVDAVSRRLRPGDLEALCTAAEREFPLFEPRAVVFWDRALPDEWPGTGADMRLLAGRADAIRTRPTPPDLTIAAASDMAFYDRYRAGYADLLEQQPAAREWTRPEEFDALEDLQRQHLVLEATTEGRWAGLVAGAPATAAGLHGIEVTEIFLLPEYRGRRYGTALSVALARESPIPGTDFIFGTIHWRNAAARAAALAAGRTDRGGEVVVPLPTAPPILLPEHRHERWSAAPTGSVSR